MSSELGFGVPMVRRDLSALREAVAALQEDAWVEATYRTPEHGRFTVSGPVRRDLTGSSFKVGWWDLTTGALEPVSDLQALTVASAAEFPEHGTDELDDQVGTLRVDDVVTTVFDFEGAGRFMVRGAVRRDAGDERWLVAGQHVSRGATPASRLRFLTVDQPAEAPSAASEQYDVFGS